MAYTGSKRLFPMTSILELRKFVAPEFIFGADARKLVSRYVTNLGGSKALIVTDVGIIAAGWVDEVTNNLEEAGFEITLFSAVTPNPRDFEVEAGARQFIEQDCDIIVAIGGGSPMDCAKGICIVVANKRPIGQFEGVDQVDIPGPPLICIPTTSGTAADLSQFAIIGNMEQQRKFAIISKMVVPDVALIDPVTNITMDSYLTACTGIDSLVHAIEAFVSSAASPITDTHALTAIRLLRQGLPVVMDRPNDHEARATIALGCLHAGLAFSNASLGAVHAMAHSLGGLLDLPHGECNALLLSHVLAFNQQTTPERFEKIGVEMGINFKGMTVTQRISTLIKEVNWLTDELGITKTLAARGVRTVDIPDLAKNALVDPCMITNPRKPNIRDIETVYEEAL